MTLEDLNKEASEIIREWDEEAYAEQIELEQLNEETLYKGNNISVHINISQDRGEGFGKDPYIKVYDAENKGKAEHMLRISMKDAGIINHAGLPPMKVNNSLMKELNKIMGKPTCCNKCKGSTVYDAIYQLIDENLAKDQYTKYKVPDFRNYYYRDDKKKGK